MKKTDGRRRRGLEYQRWCKAWLEKTYPGIVVHNQPMNHVRLPGGIWVCRSNDIFGCIDLVAVHPLSKPLFIQCTMDYHLARKQEDLCKIPWNFDHCDVQLWTKREDGHTVVWELGRYGDNPIQLTSIRTIKKGKVV